MASRIEFIELNDRRDWPVRELARLHMTYLPDSFVSLMGRHFMEWFYYGKMPKAGLIVGHAAYVDGKMSGFNVMTDHAGGFMGIGMRMLWPSLLWALFVAVARAPSRLGVLWRVWRLAREERTERLGDEFCEDLTKVILPEASAPEFKARYGSLSDRLSLLNYVRMLGKGKSVTRAVVETANSRAVGRSEGNGYVLHRVLRTNRVNPSNDYRIRIENHRIVRRWLEAGSPTLPMRMDFSADKSL